MIAAVDASFHSRFLYILGVPSILPPPYQDRAEPGGGRSSGISLRDFMLKTPDFDSGPSKEPRNDSRPPYGSPEFPSSPFQGWTPFSKVTKTFALASVSLSAFYFCENMKCRC